MNINSHIFVRPSPKKVLAIDIVDHCFCYDPVVSEAVPHSGGLLLPKLHLDGFIIVFSVVPSPIWKPYTDEDPHNQPLMCLEFDL